VFLRVGKLGWECRRTDGLSNDMDKQSTGQADLNRIPGLRQLWNQTLGHLRIWIAVLDGPAELSHPCFAGANVRHLSTTPASLRSASKNANDPHHQYLGFLGILG
jgi:hypothetical protein